MTESLLSNSRSRSVGGARRLRSNSVSSASINKASECRGFNSAISVAKKGREATIEKVRIVVLGMGGVGKSGKSPSSVDCF